MNDDQIRNSVSSLRKIARSLLEEINSLTFTNDIEVGSGVDFQAEVKAFEVQMIKRALEQTGGNQLKAAQLLRLKHTTLHTKMKRYKIQLTYRP